MSRTHRGWIALLFTLCVSWMIASRAHADPVEDQTFRPMDVFELEYASDPQISPNGKQVVYVRNFMDIMTDQRRSNLWMVDLANLDHRPLTTGNGRVASPRWSADGSRLLYLSTDDTDSTQLYSRWMDSGQTAKLTNFSSAPSGLVWSPDGSKIAFSMQMLQITEPYIKLPAKPLGAQWAEPAKVIQSLVYRSDGKGYIKDGNHHLFVLEAEGGTPRQLTAGPYNHTEAPAWTPDGRSLVFSSNRRLDWEYEPRNSEVYAISLTDRSIKQLTNRIGPDYSPAVSPDGRLIAYVGFDDRRQGYQLTQLHVMDRDGSHHRLITKFDRDMETPVWSQDGRGLFFQFDDRGRTRVGYANLTGEVFGVADYLGGTTIGRPYASGTFSVAKGGTIAFTMTKPEFPADIAIVRSQNELGMSNRTRNKLRGNGDAIKPLEQPRPHRVTALNNDLLGHKELGTVEELLYESAFDGRKVQSWIVKPPSFDSKRKYPLILEIHGGPFANYGERFAAEIQLYAAAGYVVLYVNPRGSTGYGQEFGNLIHHAYPGNDYDDLISGVDAVVARGYIDESNLFVTGGSGGGVLTAWIVGKTGRFRAAVSAKPVINWYSFALSSDAYPYFYKYWFPGFPWDHPEHYHRRSPLSLAGNVTTPTMLLTGEVDYRTPISESEQFYQALKLRKIDTALVRIPDASHAIVKRPSRLIVKVAHVLKWFETHADRSD